MHKFRPNQQVRQTFKPKPDEGYFAKLPLKRFNVSTKPFRTLFPLETELPLEPPLALAAALLRRPASVPEEDVVPKVFPAPPRPTW
jgi:hypothetical protein